MSRRYFDSVKEAWPRATTEAGPRRMAADPCTWCGHTRHAGECPRTITARAGRLETVDVRKPCPCAAGGGRRG